MIDVPSTVISLVAFLPPLIHGVEPPPLITPGVRVTRLMGFRPLSGRSMMALLSITVEMVPLVVASCVPRGGDFDGAADFADTQRDIQGHGLFDVDPDAAGGVLLESGLLRRDVIVARAAERTGGSFRPRY